MENCMKAASKKEKILVLVSVSLLILATVSMVIFGFNILNEFKSRAINHDDIVKVEITVWIVTVTLILILIKTVFGLKNLIKRREY